MLAKLHNGRRHGMTAAVCAVVLGLIYMGLAGAPRQLLLMNTAALGIGLVLVVLVDKLKTTFHSVRGPLLIGLAFGLVATALFGFRVEGAARWASLAGVTIQPSLMVVPLLVITYAARPDRWTATALLIAIAAVAAQPDRAVAAMLLAGSGVAAVIYRDRMSNALAGFAATGFVATLLQPDNLPAVPYVDQILYTAGSVHPLAGAVVWLGTLMMFLPAFTLIRTRSAAMIAMLVLWAAAIVAALLHNYPTPLVGYGASPIIGYLLGLLALPGKVLSTVDAGSTFNSETSQAADHNLKFA